MNEHDGLTERRLPVSRFENVLHGERVQVDDHRTQPSFDRQVSQIANLFLLRCDEKQIHLAVVGAFLEDLIVDAHIFEVERNVLFGLPRNLLAELCGGHERHRDLLDDHAVAARSHRDVSAFMLVKQLFESFDHHTRVDDVTVDDGIRRKRFETKHGHVPRPLAPLSYFTDLDRARPDVDTD